MTRFNLVYRLYGDTSSRFVRIEARNDTEAVLTLCRQIGNRHFTVSSIRAL